MASSGDIQTMLDFGKIVTLSSGREQKVLPLKFKQFGIVSGILKSIKINVMDEKLDVVGLITDHNEEVIKLLSVAVGWPEDEIADLYMDDIAKLAITVIEVNADFFNRRMLSSLEELKSKTSLVGQS